MDLPEINDSGEIDFDEFIAVMDSLGFVLEYEVLPVTGERIDYGNGKEQAEPAIQSDRGPSDGDAVNAAPPREGDGHQGR